MQSGTSLQGVLIPLNRVIVIESSNKWLNCGEFQKVLIPLNRVIVIELRN